MQIITVSSSAQAVTGSEKILPERALVSGIGKVIPQECLAITCRSIDLLVPGDGDWATSTLPASLIAECQYNQTDHVVAYRNDARYVQTYTPRQLALVHDMTKVLRKRGVYLITGGLGEIGLVLAEYLGQSVQARLVLVSRAEMPDKRNWESWLAHHSADNELSRVIRRLQAIEAAGGEVMIVQADAACEAHMRSAVEQTLATFGVLHGVFHAAGITSEAAFKAITAIGPAECEQQFQAKVYGTLVLEKVLRDYRLDFCLLFSSLAAVLGGITFAAYAAANSFLDAFADQQALVGTFPWVSVNWDTWQTGKKWRTGVAGKTTAAFAMTPEEAMDALTRVLASGFTRLVHSTGNLEARLRQWIDLETAHGLTGKERQQNDSRPVSGKIAALAELSTAREYEQKIVEIWQEVLGVEQIGLHDNFFELGGTSLIGLSLIARLKDDLGIEVSPVRLYEAPTVYTLAELIYKERTPDSYGEYARRGKVRKEQVKRRLQGQER